MFLSEKQIKKSSLVNKQKVADPNSLQPNKKLFLSKKIEYS